MTASIRVEKAGVRRGEEFNVVVDVQIAAGWHIYAMDRPAGAAASTRIHLQFPRALNPTESGHRPTPC